MPFQHELDSYAHEIEQLKEDFGSLHQREQESPDLHATHYSLCCSNRANMTLVGICSLVEAFVTNIALEHFSEDEVLAMSDRPTLMKKVKRKIGVDCTKSPFEDFFTIRHVLVHGYGGLVPSRKAKDLKEALKKLDLEEKVFAAERRIRLTPVELKKAHAAASELIQELMDAAYPTVS
jgi:hypothetical protein